MIRPFRRAPRCASVLAIALVAATALTACGIKGPLKPPPKAANTQLPPDVGPPAITPGPVPPAPPPATDEPSAKKP